MHEPHGRAGDRWRWAPPDWAGFLGTGLVAVALATACSSTPTSSTQSQSQYSKAVAFTQCMRAHGVPRFPDPDSQGHFDLLGNNLDPGSSQFQAAQTACRHLYDAGIQSPAQHAQQVSQALKYAMCMRSHGIAKFPDPPSSGQQTVNPEKLGINPNSPLYLNAQQACRKYLPGLPG